MARAYKKPDWYDLAVACLIDHWITPEQARRMSDRELLRLPNMGNTRLRALREKHPELQPA